MARFDARPDNMPVVSSVALNTSAAIKIKRDFAIERIDLRVFGTITGAIATATADGLLGILKTVQLTVNLPGSGNQARNYDVLPSVSGRGLLEFFYRMGGNLDISTWTAKDKTTTGAFEIVYPIYFAPPRTNDPIASLFALPAPLALQDIQLNLQFAAQADVDSNVSPTFAISAGLSYQVLVQGRNIPLTDSKGNIVFNTLQHSIVETPLIYTAAQPKAEFDFPNQTSFAAMLLRCYTSATARGDVSISGGGVSLETPQITLRRQTLRQIEIGNDRGAARQDVYFAGAYLMPMIRDREDTPLTWDPNQMISTINPGVVAAPQLKLKTDVNGGSGVQIKYMYWRVDNPQLLLPYALK